MDIRQAQKDTVSSVKARQDVAEGILSSSSDYRNHLMRRDTVSMFLEQIQHDIRAACALGSGSESFIVIKHDWASLSSVSGKTRLFCLGRSSAAHDRHPLIGFGETSFPGELLEEFATAIRQEFPPSQGWDITWTQYSDEAAADMAFQFDDDKKGVAGAWEMRISWLPSTVLRNVITSDVQDWHIDAINRGVPAEDVFAVSNHLNRSSPRYCSSPDA